MAHLNQKRKCKNIFPLDLRQLMQSCRRSIGSCNALKSRTKLCSTLHAFIQYAVYLAATSKASLDLGTYISGQYLKRFTNVN